MFGWEFPPFISGGLGTACFEMTRAITSRGHSITLILPRHDKDSSLPFEETKAGIFPLPSFRDMNRTDDRLRATATIENLNIIYISALLYPYMHADNYQSAYLSAKKYLPNNRVIYGGDLVSEAIRYGLDAAALSGAIFFDVIHSHDWMTIPAAILARKTSSKPWILHVHSLEYDRSGDHGNRDILQIEREGLEKADRIIAVSSRTKRMIIELYGISPEKISVIYNAVFSTDKPMFTRRSDSDHHRTVLFLGRITFQKGPDYFVEAASLVLKEFPDVTFVMAGAGDMMEQMIRRVGELGIGSHFHFTGFLQGEEIENLFATSDLYVMPSVSEPFGISPLEAMAYDVPVIISRQSGVAEILKSALKVDFWNVTEMASLILSVLKHPALTETITDEARKELKNIQWKKSADRIIKTYWETVQNATKL
jgi:glycosyltransferase involved in cell wall biosynthesis